MKKIFFSSIVISCCFLCACSDFLELYPKTTLNEGNFFRTEQELILLANGCYAPLRNNTKVVQWLVAEMRSDNTSYQRPSDGGNWARQRCDEFLYESNNPHFSDLWNTSYQGIYRCNQLLSNIDRSGISWNNESYKDRCKGEAYFFRALYYFDLVRQFGGVPIVTKAVTAQEAVDIKRSTIDQVYELIINDLKESTNHFLLSVEVQEEGRANNFAALSLLGRVYLTRHSYQEAESVLNSVMSSGKYRLRTDYADLFNPSAKDYQETIFAVQYSENNADLANNFIFNFVPWRSGGEITNRPNVGINDAGWNQPTEDLIKAFEPGDLRKDVAIHFWTGPDSDMEIRTIPYCAKYKPPVSAPDNRCGDNFPVIRYADILLMYAEVLNEQGKTSQAIPYVEQVRARAGLANSLSGYDKNALEELIAAERQREFCFENQRWYDLLRTGKAIEVMTAHGQRELALKPYLTLNSYDMKEYKLLAPIPIEEILRNKIEQNPGY